MYFYIGPFIEVTGLPETKRFIQVTTCVNKNCKLYQLNTLKSHKFCPDCGQRLGKTQEVVSEPLDLHDVFTQTFNDVDRFTVVVFYEKGQYLILPNKPDQGGMYIDTSGYWSVEDNDIRDALQSHVSDWYRLTDELKKLGAGFKYRVGYVARMRDD